MNILLLFVVEEDDNWYSSDEEGEGPKKITDILKNIATKVKLSLPCTYWTLGK